MGITIGIRAILVSNRIQVVLSIEGIFILIIYQVVYVFSALDHVELRLGESKSTSNQLFLGICGCHRFISLRL